MARAAQHVPDVKPTAVCAWTAAALAGPAAWQAKGLVAASLASRRRCQMVAGAVGAASPASVANGVG